MRKVNSTEILKENIATNQMVLLYFGSKACGVCTVIKPKMQELINDYPLISGFEVDIETSPQLSAEYNIFTIPAVLLFIDGKEILREARYINLQELAMKTDRYYALRF